MKILIALLVILLISSAPVSVGSSSKEPNILGTIVSRTVPLTIKVVLVGFDPNTVDLNYLNWNGNLIESSINNVLSTGNVTGIAFDLTYEFVFTRTEFKQNLTDYLKSIEKVKTEYNPWFRAQTRSFLYDAAKAEDWFMANNASYGGFPTQGYTFVFANLTTLPSITDRQLESDDATFVTPHYYATPYVDKDLNYRIRYRDFSVAWGGKYRLWFLDLAAGPEFWTWNSSDAVPHIPIQIALDRYEVDVYTSFGKRWLTQYLSDYITEAVLNLAVPVYTYQPVYSRSYRIVLNIIDNRTEEERYEVPIESTIRPELVREAFADLLPYAQVQVETKIRFANDVPSLQKAIVDSTVTPPSELGISPFVDLRPLYRYLQEHVADLAGNVRRDSVEFTLPVFGFAFAKGAYLGYTYKWDVTSEVELDKSNFMGIALGDMALIGLTQNELQRGNIINPPQPGKGIGFTQVAIHEVGHLFGLMHPHQFGYLGDFESSAMSYWAWEYRFSQFDKDTINRGHADLLISSALANLAEAQNILGSKFYIGLGDAKITAAKDLIDRALDKYNSMEYAQTVEIAIEASRASADASTSIASAPNGMVTATLISLIVGLTVGSILIFLAFRKYLQATSKIS